MMLSKDPQVTQSCVATSKRLHMEFYALVSRNCHRNVAGNSYALIFKVPVINYGRVRNTIAGSVIMPVTDSCLD